MTPVNYVARALVTLATKPDTWGGTYNLVAQHDAPMTDLEEQLRRHGFGLRASSIEEFGLELFTTAETLSAAGDDSLMRAMLVATQFADGVAGTTVYDDSNTRAALAGTGVECPIVGPEILGRYVEYYARIGFFKALAGE